MDDGKEKESRETEQPEDEAAMRRLTLEEKSSGQTKTLEQIFKEAIHSYLNQFAANQSNQPGGSGEAYKKPTDQTTKSNQPATGGGDGKPPLRKVRRQQYKPPKQLTYTTFRPDGTVNVLQVEPRYLWRRNQNNKMRWMEKNKNKNKKEDEKNGSRKKD
uniref:Uncharacterized protein n=1 Tax=Lygus hesperus TaxID=30085 RepID=A0A0K8SBL6_LYGHE